MELLPQWMQYSFAAAVWAGAMFAVVYGFWWGIQRIRKYRSNKESTFDS